MTSPAPRIPAFAPVATRGPLYRFLGWLLLTRFGRWYAMEVATRVDPWLLDVTGGRVGLGLSLPSLSLTTTGARSGARRSAAVLYFSDGDDVILIASNFGQDHHPARYHNLVAHPHAELERGGVRARYRAIEVTDPAERDRLYALATAMCPVYEDYRRRTAAIGRRIPVLRLAPVPPPAESPDTQRA